jgi:uridine kinase
MLETHHERIRSIFLEKIREELKQDFEQFTEYRRTRCQSDSSVGSTSENEYATTMMKEEIREQWRKQRGGV